MCSLTLHHNDSKHDPAGAAGSHGKKPGRGRADRDGGGDSVSEGLWFHAEKLVGKVAGHKRGMLIAMCSLTIECVLLP